jgi:hypothetical protein
MDNRPETSEDEQTTPEHESGRVVRHGYSKSQPDRSGTEALPMQAVGESNNDSVHSANASSTVNAATAHSPRSASAAASILDRTVERIRRYPLQALVGTIGILAVMSIVRGRGRMH